MSEEKIVELAKKLSDYKLSKEEKLKNLHLIKVELDKLKKELD